MAADLIVTVKAMLDQYKREIDDAAAQTEEFSSRGSGAIATLNENIGTITAVTAGAGAALEGFARGQAVNNESIARAAIVTGESKEALRQMIGELTNSTNSSSDMIEAMDALIRRGIDTKEGFENVLPVFDNFSGATGQDMPDAIRTVSEVLNALDIPIEDVGENIDQMTRFVRQTDVPMGTLRRNLGRIPDELRDMDFGLHDVAAGIEVFRDRGFTGQEAVREFRRAMEESEGDFDALLDNLGLTAEEFAEYQDQVGEAEGITKKFADANAEQLTPIQQAQQFVQNLAVEYGGFATTAAQLAPALIGAGPAIKGVSLALGGLKTAMAVAFGPAGLVIAAAAAVGLFLTKTETGREILGLFAEGFGLIIQAGRDVAEFIGPWVDQVVGAVSSMVDRAVSGFQAFDQRVAAIVANIGQVISSLTTVVKDVATSVRQFVGDVIGFFGDLKDDVVGLIEDTKDAVVEQFTGMFTGAVDSVKNMAGGVTGWLADMAKQAVGNSIIPDMVAAVLEQFDFMHTESVDVTRDMSTDVISEAQTMADALVGIGETLGIEWLEKIGGLVDGTLGKFRELVGGAQSLIGDLATVFDGVSSLFGGDGLSIEGDLLGSLASGASNLFGGGGGLGSLFGSAGGISKVLGALKGGGAFGAVEAGTGATAALGPGLAAFAGPAAIAGLGLFAASQIGTEENRRERFGALSRGGSAALDGVDAALAGFSEGQAFVGGPAAGFIAGEAQRAGFGGLRKPGDAFGTVGGGFRDADPQQLLEVIREAIDEFGRLEEVGEQAFGGIGVSAGDVARIIQDDSVTAAELFGVELDGLAALAEQTGAIGAQEFGRIAEAVNRGEIRVEALAGQVGFTSDEMAVLARAGVRAGGDVARGAGEGEGAVRAMGGTANETMGLIQTASQTAADTLGTSFTTATQVASQGMSRLRDDATNSLGAITSAAGKASGAVSSLAGRAESAAKSAIRNIQSISSSGPKIHGFADGAIVTGPTLALIGEGRDSEVVFPLERLNEFLQANVGGGGRAGLSVNLTQHVNGATPGEVERQTRRAMNRVALEWEAS